MSEPRLSPATKALLRAARTEGPSAATRAKMWSSVSGTVGGAAGAAGVAGAAGSGVGVGSGIFATGGSATKMLAMGTLLGGTVTVGLATVLLGIGPTPHPPSVRPSAPMVAAAPAPRPSPIAPLLQEPGAIVLASAEVPDSVSASASSSGSAASRLATSAASTAGRSSALRATSGAKQPASVNPVHAARPSAPSPLEADRLLTQEAALVSEARDALMRGDPPAALRAVKAARALPSHRLAPEELSVESQALRALGREDDARETDSALKKQFPESGLAR